MPLAIPARAMRALCVPLVLVACVLAGCATPNLQPFAEQTARLAAAVSGEHAQIAIKLEQVVELSSEACSLARRNPRDDGGKVACQQAVVRGGQVKEFAESRRVVDALLERAVAYATTLAALGAAGETGADAAQSLIGTVRDFATVIPVGSFAASPLISGVIGKIATAVTRVQAQQSLLEAATAAQPAVNALAEGIGEIVRADDKILDALHSDEKDTLLTLAGVDLVGLFQDASISRNEVSGRLRQRRDRLSELRACGAPGGAKDEACVQIENELRNAEDLGRLLDRLRPEYEAYAVRRDAATAWRLERREASAGIVRATGVWEAEHARVVDWLKRCGGTQAHRCIEFDAATLRVAIDRIETVREQIRSLRSK